MGHDPRQSLRSRGLRARKGLSQNFLRAPHVAERMAEALRRAGHPTVLEIGPGTGALTRPLLARGLRVLALERDPRMVALLGEELAAAVAEGRLALREGDARRIDLPALADEHGLAELPVGGNLPYAITGTLLRRLVEGADVVPLAVVMVQQEVADRLLAPAGSRAYGAPTVFVSARYRVERLLRVPATAFHPPPRVWSAVLALRRLEQPRAPVDAAFEQVVRAAFGQRRKTLRNALRPLGLPREALEETLRTLGVGDDARGETLAVEQFDALAELLRDGPPPHRRAT